MICVKFDNIWHPPQVSKIVRHPQFDAKRLSDDIAVMITSRVIGEDFFFCKRLSTPQNHWYLCILWFPRVYNN